MTVTLPVIVVSTIFIALLALMLYFYKQRDGDSVFVCFMFIIVVIFIGYGPICSAIPFYSGEKIVVPDSFSNSNSFVAAICRNEDGGTITVFSDKAFDVNRAVKGESPKIRIHNGINAWGIIVKQEFSICFDNSDFPDQNTNIKK